MNKFLTREDIIGKQDLCITSLEVPEWDAMVYIRRWKGKERSRFLRTTVKEEGEADLDSIFENMSLVVSMSLCDENGNLLFNDSKEDLELLGSKDANAIQRIYEAVLALNTLGKDALKNAAKNSGTIQKKGSI